MSQNTPTQRPFYFLLCFSAPDGYCLDQRIMGKNYDKEINVVMFPSRGASIFGQGVVLTMQEFSTL